MKVAFLMMILMSFSGFAFAEQVESDCPMTLEENQRVNPKQVVKPSVKTETKKQGVQQ